MTKKEAIDNLRNKTLARVIKFLTMEEEQVEQTKSGTVMFPTIDELGNECFVTITIQIPKGSRDGEAYDGYAEAANYALETAQKQEEKLVKEEQKQKKIARDKKMREDKTKKKEEAVK